MPATTTGSVDIADTDISGNTAGGNGGGIWLPHDNLDLLTVGANAVFSRNSASTAYLRNPADDTLYANQIFAPDINWTIPFTQGYNNYDIGYVNGMAYSPNPAMPPAALPAGPPEVIDPPQFR